MIINHTARLKSIIENGARTAMNERQFYECEIRRWKASEARKLQIIGEEYYLGKQDILKRKRTVIGENGALQEVENLPNNRLVDNQYAKMVDQKTNYLLGKPLTFDTDDEAYEAALREVFDKKFHRTLRNLGMDALNGGIGWLYFYYDEDGKFRFKRFAPYECLPLWKDAEHTILDSFVRVYSQEVYEGQKLTIVDKVEIYKDTGIERYELSSSGSLIDDIQFPSSDYMTLEDKDSGTKQPFNWGKIPMIPFKYNNKETPLIRKIKSLQDAINAVMSDYQNNMQEDARSTVLIIKNYDGQNLGEFRRNLATYGAIKVRNDSDDKGGVEALQVEVNSENYKVILDLLKKAIIENAMGYDAKDDRLGGAPNQMNIQSMYSDIDLDANGMETEWQAAFEDLLWFVKAHLSNNGNGDFDSAEVEIIFNRDMIFNEAEIMTTLQQCGVVISNETLLGQVPFIDDVKKERERIKTEKQDAIDEYSTSFPNEPFGMSGDEGGEGDD